jgi:hypothetical protein
MSHKRKTTNHKCVVIGCKRSEIDVCISYHEFPSETKIYSQWCRAVNIQGETKGIISSYLFHNYYDRVTQRELYYIL